MPSKNVKSGKGNGNPDDENGSSEKGGGGGATRSDFLKDFEIIVPKKRIARIGGEEIDVSALTSRISLEFAAFAEKYNYIENDIAKADFNPEMLLDMVTILGLVCQKSSKKMDADWLLDNLELPVLVDLMKYVFDPMTSKMKDLKSTVSAYETSAEGTGKN